MAVLAPTKYTRDYKENSLANDLAKYLAHHYLLMLKAQNYHWNIVGKPFPVYHTLFEKLYQKLYEDTDLVAERIRAMGFIVPASFSEYTKLSDVKEGDPRLAADDMLNELTRDYETLVQHGHGILSALKREEDEVTLSLLSDHLVDHEKLLWMFQSTTV